MPRPLPAPSLRRLRLDVAREDGVGGGSARPAFSRCGASSARASPRRAPRSRARRARRRAGRAARPCRRHHRLQQDRGDAQRLHRHVEHDRMRAGSVLASFHGSAWRNSGWPRRRPRTPRRYRDGAESSPCAARASPSERVGSRQHRGSVRRRRRAAPVGHRAAAVPGDHRQRALREIAEIVGEIGVDARDDRLVRIVAVLAERHFAQEEIAHGIEAVSRRPDRPGSTTLPTDFDIFSPRLNRKPCTTICLGSGRPADIRNAGQ